MKNCPACNEPVRWFHRTAPPTNDGWHRRCWIGFKHGHATATRFCTEENKMADLPTPTELYRRRCLGVPLSLQAVAPPSPDLPWWEWERTSGIEPVYRR